MPSRYGKTHGLIGYDEFRTGFTYSEIREMLFCDSPDPKQWRYKTRGVVLGMWHEIKLQMYNQYLDALETSEDCHGQHQREVAAATCPRLGLE